MLNQKDIDTLKDSIDSGKDTYIWYAAHMIEGRETNILDEHMFKSVSQFKVVKLKVKDIVNAYFEYMNFIDHPDQYHTEDEECSYKPGTKYIHYFSVKNVEGPFDKDINARMPCNIYGYRRKVYIGDELINDYNDPSPVKEVYTNEPEYMDYKTSKVIKMINDGKLDWKYLKLNNNEVVDGIEYKYVTSDWYIMDLENYPMVEKPLINIKQHSGYFMTQEGAFRYIEQLVA